VPFFWHISGLVVLGFKSDASKLKLKLQTILKRKGGGVVFSEDHRLYFMLSVLSPELLVESYDLFLQIVDICLGWLFLFFLNC
jgi:hypothetical protein